MYVVCISPGFDFWMCPLYPTIAFQCHILLYAQLTLQLLGSRHWKRNCPRTDSTDWKHHPKTLRPNAPLYILLVYSRICWLTLRVASCFCLSDIKKRTNTEIFLLPCGSDVFPGAGESQRPTQVKPGILLKAAVNYFCLTCHKPFHNDEPLPVVNKVFSR